VIQIAEGECYMIDPCVTCLCDIISDGEWLKDVFEAISISEYELLELIMLTVLTDATSSRNDHLQLERVPWLPFLAWWHLRLLQSMLLGAEHSKS
jgi:hypothetical protein